MGHASSDHLQNYKVRFLLSIALEICYGEEILAKNLEEQD